nr:MetaGeneMark_Unknown Function [uncultured bacterium]
MTNLKFAGIVESGAPLAVWKSTREAASTSLSAETIDVEFNLKPLPSLAEIESQWQACDDPVMKERLYRKRGVRKVVGDGDITKMPLWIWRIGGALLAGQPNEAYSKFQIDLRAALSSQPIAVMNIVNGSAGYLPPRELYEHDIYQVWQSPYECGSLEKLIETAITRCAPARRDRRDIS